VRCEKTHPRTRDSGLVVPKLSNPPLPKGSNRAPPTLHRTAAPVRPWLRLPLPHRHSVPQRPPVCAQGMAQPRSATAASRIGGRQQQAPKQPDSTHHPRPPSVTEINCAHGRVRRSEGAILDDSRCDNTRCARRPPKPPTRLRTLARRCWGSSASSVVRFQPVQHAGTATSTAGLAGCGNWYRRAMPLPCRKSNTAPKYNPALQLPLGARVPTQSR